VSTTSLGFSFLVKSVRVLFNSVSPGVVLNAVDVVIVRGEVLLLFASKDVGGILSNKFEVEDVIESEDVVSSAAVEVLLINIDVEASPAAPSAAAVDAMLQTVCCVVLCCVVLVY